MKHALVTGGTRGIGLGVTRTLLAEGWAVTATGVNDDEVAACPDDDGLTAVRLDVTDEDRIAELFTGLGQLDGLVNCAGILLRGEEYDIGKFCKVIDVNLTGTMRMCLAAHPFLERSGGAIVNTASMLSYFGGALVPAYSASKGGVAQLTKSLAANWASDGIRVNAVAPGWIETEMTAGLRRDSQRESAILGRTPLGRWGQPEEVGALAAWLLSEKARFVTGAVYPVDGGYSAV
ncbi:SDR family NAD(P)-dependent oxidoreductase [Roseibium aggregatum]|uniref:SDR family oxidoreductase n=1 Tax=Roseibium aggregatum TaxID=187304 RepID=A0A939J4U3_9HYPH|nr:SDR family oxidoreductase [Roseibium aggregatum]MBN9671535.1 SDR family oxidoreductase [Roseibium aggregatum]